MKTKNSLAFILCSSLLIATVSAQAGDRSGDALLGGLIGGGAGAVIGQHVGGRDGAIIGGALGAATGVAITTDSGRHGRYVAAPAYVPVYTSVYTSSRPAVYYYSPQAVYVERRGHDYYKYQGRHGKYRHGRGGWRDDHHGHAHDEDHRDHRHWD
ncbi:MAG: hypothetical protein Q7J21_08180 [Rugosibacter sp.]|nr:hypothetical protein [Rugosibacter sp.]